MLCELFLCLPQVQVTVVVTAAVVDSAIVLDVLNSKLKFTFLLEIFSWLMSLDLRSSWLRDVIYPVSGVHTSLAHQTSWGCFRHWRGAVSCWVQLELCAKSNCHEYFCAHGTHIHAAVTSLSLHARWLKARNPATLPAHSNSLSK